MPKNVQPPVEMNELGVAIFCGTGYELIGSAFDGKEAGHGS